MSNTIKSDKIALEQLLNSISPAKQDTAQDNVKTVVDNNGGAAALENPEPIFTFDVKAEKKALTKRAKRTVMLMAEHALPQNLMEESYVQNKIEQDIETLSDLYWQVKSNSLMQNALLDVVSRGNTMPRNFEVFTQLTEKISALNKQIQVTEATMRKTYLDLKFEIRDKENETGIYNTNQLPDGNKEPGDNHNVITGGGKLSELLMYKKMQILSAENNIDEQ